MPLYEYVCNKGHEFEVQQGINDDALSRCQEPGCRAKASRMISRNGFSLGGGGWYADGYGKKSGKSAGKETKPSGCGSACAANGGKSDGKAKTQKAAASS